MYTYRIINSLLAVFYILCLINQLNDAHYMPIAPSMLAGRSPDLLTNRANELRSWSRSHGLSGSQLSTLTCRKQNKVCVKKISKPWWSEDSKCERKKRTLAGVIPCRSVPNIRYKSRDRVTFLRQRQWPSLNPKILKNASWKGRLFDYWLLLVF